MADAISGMDTEEPTAGDTANSVKMSHKNYTPSRRCGGGGQVVHYFPVLVG
jgi:hypothetical protein